MCAEDYLDMPKDMYYDSAKGYRYWYNVFQKKLAGRKMSDLFMLEAVCYPPFPFIFKRILSYFEHHVLKKLLLKHKIGIKDKRILDIGCGGGRFSYFFANGGGCVTGIDFVENVIERNRKYFPHIRFEQMNACDLKFLDNTFDLVNAFITLQHITSNQKILALKEMIRVLKPCAYMFIFESHRHKRQMQSEQTETLTHEEWKKIFAELDLTLIDSHHLHFFPLYGVYRYMNQRVYNIYKGIKSVFIQTHEECCQKAQTASKNLDNQNISSRYKLYDIINRNILRVIACLSFPIEFMYISNLMRQKNLMGSHTMYLLQKS